MPKVELSIQFQLIAVTISGVTHTSNVSIATHIPKEFSRDVMITATRSARTSIRVAPARAKTREFLRARRKMGSSITERKLFGKSLKAKFIL
jgi:hypothetical protein